jgi:dephospho-CoA kinase
MSTILIGLTGGVGMGKSTAGECLRTWGLPVLDTDQLARDLVEPGQPALDEIVRAFGDRVVDPAGRLRREALAEVVFADPAQRRRLEAILHPRIRERWQSEAAEWRRQHLPVGVVIIPLLFETNAQAEFDAVICVACTSASQRARLEARGWRPDQIDARLRAQWPAEDKIRQSHFLIWTEGGTSLTTAQVRRILDGLVLRPTRRGPEAGPAAGAGL